MAWRNLYGLDWTWDGGIETDTGENNANNFFWTPPNSRRSSRYNWQVLNATYGTLTNSEQAAAGNLPVLATGTGEVQAMSLLMNNTLATSGINYDAVAAEQANYRATGYAGLQRYSTMPIINNSDSTQSNSFILPLVIGGLAFFFLK